MKQHGVVIDIPNNALLVQGNTFHFNNQLGNPKVSLLRTEVSHVLLPGEHLQVPVPTNFITDKEIAVEPRESIPSFPEPCVLKNEDGMLTIPNMSNEPIKIKRNQVIGQIRSIVTIPVKKRLL